MQHPVTASITWPAAIIAVFAPAAIQPYPTRTSRQTPLAAGTVPAAPHPATQHRTDKAQMGSTATPPGA